MPVRIRIAPDREEVISIFLAQVSESGSGPQTPLELFSGSNEFIAAETQTGNIVFIRRGTIDVVTIDLDEELEGNAAGANSIDTNLDIRQSISIELEGGIVLHGVTQYQLPDTNSRLSDFLNTPPLFLPLHESDRIHLINKRRIERVNLRKIEKPWLESID